MWEETPAQYLEFKLQYPFLTSDASVAHKVTCSFKRVTGILIVNEKLKLSPDDVFLSTKLLKNLQLCSFKVTFLKIRRKRWFSVL